MCSIGDADCKPYHTALKMLHSESKDILKLHLNFTPSISEIIWVRNVRAIVVCGFFMKSLKTYPENLKKIVGAVWELPAR